MSANDKESHQSNTDGRLSFFEKGELEALIWPVLDETDVPQAIESTRRRVSELSDEELLPFLDFKAVGEFVDELLRQEESEALRKPVTDITD